MDAGPLNQRIAIMSRTDEPPGAFGDVAETESTIWECWASVESLRGDELMDAQQIKARMTHRVKIRWVPTVFTAKMVIVLGTRNFEIMAPPTNWNEGNEMIVFMCREMA